MIASEISFLKTICRACLNWEDTSDLPATVKRMISIITIVQAILETGWGSSWLGNAPYFNMGGVKHHLAEWPGVSTKTREVIAGENKVIEDAFQCYPTMADYIADHFDVLWQWKCVRDAVALSLKAALPVLGPWTDADRAFYDAGNLDACTHSNYSTDPTYGATLMELVDDCGLIDPSIVERYAV